jgi:hypothetical protein
MKKGWRPGFLELGILVVVLGVLVLGVRRLIQLFRTDWPTVLAAMSLGDWVVAVGCILIFLAARAWIERR